MFSIPPSPEVIAAHFALGKYYASKYSETNNSKDKGIEEIVKKFNDEYSQGGTFTVSLEHENIRRKLAQAIEAYYKGKMEEVLGVIYRAKSLEEVKAYVQHIRSKVIVCLT